MDYSKNALNSEKMFPNYLIDQLNNNHYLFTGLVFIDC